MFLRYRNGMTALDPSYDDDSPTDRLVLWPCAVALGICLLAVIVLTTWPRTGQPVAIVFPPWLTLTEIDDRIAQAGGVLVDFGALKGVVIAISEDAFFAERLYDNGALWALDGSFSGSLCTVPQI